MKNILPIYLHKNEDAAAYKRFADEGMDLMFPVKMKGKTHRPDINIPYHSTIKLFDSAKDNPAHAHEVASKLSLNPPNPKEVGIEPITLKGRTGYTIHALKLHGPHAEAIKEHHKKFSHLGFKENYEFHPHISVDKETWDHVVNSKAKNAHEAGIEFMPAELHHKTKVLSSYKPKVAAPAGGDHQGSDKLAASENMIPQIVRETIHLHSSLQKHIKATMLSDQEIFRYLQDNPNLKGQILQKHEARLSYHLGNDLDLIKVALEKGLSEAYKVKNGK